MHDSAPPGVPAQPAAHDGAAACAELQRLRAEVTQLRTALARRPVIDMAKGAVMAVARCDEDAAFQQLSRVSQAHNVKLFDLAQALVQDLPASVRHVAPREPQPVPRGVRDLGRLVACHWTRV